MKRLFRNPLKLFVILFVTVVFTTVAYAAEEQKEVSLGLPQQIGNFYAFALGIGGLIALGVLVFGGILYTTSAGNTSRQDDAKQWITGAFVGLIILFGSFFILNIINPELTKLTDLELLANKAVGGLPSPGDETIEGGTGFGGSIFLVNNLPVQVQTPSCYSYNFSQTSFDVPQASCPVSPLATGLNVTDSFCEGRNPGTTGASNVHHGTDIIAQEGSPVYAFEDGTIYKQGWNDTGGNRLWLRGKSGLNYYYAHLRGFAPSTSNGQEVTAGALLGFVGNTGNAYQGGKGVHHLHFEIYPGEQTYGVNAINAKPILDQICKASPGGTPTESPALAQVLNKPQYSSFGIAFQEIGGQGTSINSSKQLQSASLYKLFVAKYLYEQREKGRISFDATVDLDRIDLAYAKREDQRDVTPYPWGTRTKIPIRECLPQMISASENACGAALKALARDLAGGESQINAQIGGNSTLYPQRTTAEDVANLLSQIAQGKLVNQAVSAEFEGLLQNQIHQNKIPEGVPSGAQVGNKTGEIWPDEGLGYTNSHDAAIIRYNGKAYILVVLTTYNPADGRTNQTIQQLTRELFTALK